MPAKKTAKPESQLKNIDALFGLDGGESNSKFKVQEVSIEKFVPFKMHPFRIYEGERLFDMIESVKANGVLIPVIARKISGNDKTVEILSGHNRISAAKAVKLKTVPTVILEGITDEQAMVYVVETNLIQRSFNDMRHSEKATVIALHHNKMFSQGKRNDILEQLKALENPEQTKIDTSSHCETKLGRGQRTDDKIGAMYSLNRNTVARYVRVDKLTHELKVLLNDGSIPFLAAVELSFLQNDEQHQLVHYLNDGHAINERKAKALREQSKAKTLDDDTMQNIIVGQTGTTKIKPRRVNINSDFYSKYFTPEQSTKEVESIVEQALLLYFNDKSDVE